MSPYQPIQLLDAESSTYSYLLVDATTREAVLIDPVEGEVERDLAALREQGEQRAKQRVCARRTE